MAQRGHLVTANRLRDGVPVYRTVEGGWSLAIAEAGVFANGEGERALVAAQQAPLPLPVVAPYLIEAQVENGAIRPVGLREHIRAYGPTI